MTTEPESATQRPATTIKTVDGGPLQIKGAFQIVDHDGTAYDLEGRRSAFLCRCGQSATKPFCDGTHKKIGFDADHRAPTAQDQE